MATWYDLDERGNPVIRPSGGPTDEEWTARWESSRGLRCWRIALDEDIEGTGAYVSSAHGPAILWETMAFTVPGSDGLDWSDRYTSRAEAVAGHARILAEVRQHILNWKEEQAAVDAVRRARDARLDIQPLSSGVRHLDLED